MSERPSTPVVPLDGEPFEAGGHGGRAMLRVALVRRGTISTVLGFDQDTLTVLGHITWIAASDSDGGPASEVTDAHVREDRAEHGVGRGLVHAARELAGVGTWLGVPVPDSEEADTWLGLAGAGGSHPTGPVVDLAAGQSAGGASAGEEHVVFHRDGRAAVVALAVKPLTWVGHLAWTINRPGGRLGGALAGRAVGEVQRVDTRERFGKRGVATRMYRAAQAIAAGQGWPPEIDHSPDRTRFGDRWAKKVGGWRPPLTNGQFMPEYGDLLRKLGGLG